jgi:hypothetical protein
MGCVDPRAPLTPLRVTRGASRVFLLTVRADLVTGDLSAAVAGVDQASPGNPVDLTGARVWFTVKNRVEDPAATIAKRNLTAGGVDNQILVVAPQTGVTAGQFRVLLDPADTAGLDPSATFWCDAWVQLPGGPPLQRYQVMANRQLIVSSGVTTAF